jgi:hypothetical protein
MELWSCLLYRFGPVIEGAAIIFLIEDNGGSGDAGALELGAILVGTKRAEYMTRGVGLKAAAHLCKTMVSAIGQSHAIGVGLYA